MQSDHPNLGVHKQAVVWTDSFATIQKGGCVWVFVGLLGLFFKESKSFEE